MVSRSAPARGMRLEATPRACGLRLLTVLAATKLLQWKKSFRCSFEKNASMRESGGEEGSFADLLPTQLFNNLFIFSENVAICEYDALEEFRSSRRALETTERNRNAGATSLRHRAPLTVGFSIFSPQVDPFSAASPLMFCKQIFTSNPMLR